MLPPFLPEVLQAYILATNTHSHSWKSILKVKCVLFTETGQSCVCHSSSFCFSFSSFKIHRTSLALQGQRSAPPAVCRGSLPDLKHLCLFLLSLANDSAFLWQMIQLCKQLYKEDSHKYVLKFFLPSNYLNDYVIRISFQNMVINSIIGQWRSHFYLVHSV